MTVKKKINSKAKGSSYELKIAKTLGAWWEEDFKRTPMSGGLHWDKDNRVCGDIVPPINSVYPYSVECKKREEWNLEQVLKGTGDIESWWKQCLQDSERVDLRPMLIFSKNFAPDYLMLRYEDFHLLGSNVRAFNYYVIHSSKAEDEDRIICLLSDFIQHMPKDFVLKSYNL